MASAVSIATAYIVGGCIPLGPYMAMNVTAAFRPPSLIRSCPLAIFGYVKGHFTGASPPRSALKRYRSADWPSRRHRDRKSDLMTGAAVARVPNGIRRRALWS